MSGPQPRLEDGVPICDGDCPYFRPNIGESADCSFTGNPTDDGIPCLPAIVEREQKIGAGLRLITSKLGPANDEGYCELTSLEDTLDRMRSAYITAKKLLQKREKL